MRPASTLLMAASWLVLAPGLFAQATWYVDAVRGNDASAGTSTATAFRTLTRASSAAVSGDTISAAPGVYAPSQGSFLPIAVPAGVALRGADPRTTIIDGEYSPISAFGGHLVQLESGCSLSGFCVRNGVPSSSGWWSAAIRIGGTGGGSVDGVTVERCIVEDVSRGLRVGGPGAISVTNLTVRYNLLRRCGADAISCWSNPTGTSSNNLIANNTVRGQGGAASTRSALTLADGMVAEARNNVFEGFDFCGLEIGPGCVVASNHNDFWNHTGTFGGDYCIDPAATFNASGDSFLDPLFGSNDDPHLGFGSPCIGAGLGSGALVDLDGNDRQGAVDQGCDERMLHTAEAELYFWRSRALVAGAPAELRFQGRPSDRALVYASAILSLGGPIDLGSLNILYLDPLAMFVVVGTQLDGAGRALLIIPSLPNDPFLLGRPLLLQSLHFDASLSVLGLSDLESFAYGR